MEHRIPGLEPLAVVLMGVCGSGKSTLGMELASVLGCPFLEGDAFHAPESVERMRAGEPLTDEDRWPWLDRVGLAVAADVNRCGLAVVACSALKRAYRDRLRSAIGVATRFVLLDGELAELRWRLSNRPGHYMPVSLLPSQLAILERPRPDETALTLDASLSPTELCGRVIGWLEPGSR